MQDFIFFLGRFHVLALHLPIGMVVVAVAVDWFSRAPQRRAMAVAVPFLWGATAISAIVTVALGYMHFAEGGFVGPSASAHRLWGTIVAVFAVSIWLLSAFGADLHRRLSPFSGILMLVLVTMTGHYGGNLTHGADYLVEYAPGPMRAALGLGARRAAITDIAAADPWLDIVQPMLNSRCASCHNADKRNGELSVVDYESLMRGGETGRVVSLGNAQGSELYLRVTLPQSDDAFMPAEGKTPLTQAQVEALRWWIDAEAPRDTMVGDLNVSAEDRSSLSAAIGLGASAAVSVEQSAETADAATVDALFAAGFLVRQQSESDAGLQVSIHSVGTNLSEAQFASLSEAANDIVSLDLQSAGLRDADVAQLSRFAALRFLRLSNNELGDEAVSALSALQDLEVLNLYGNAGVTDASIEALASMSGLQAVYLWQTGMTDAGIEQLRAQRPDLKIQGAAEPSQ